MSSLCQLTIHVCNVHHENKSLKVKTSYRLTLMCMGKLLYSKWVEDINKDGTNICFLELIHKAKAINQTISCNVHNIHK